jgi:hypothetical protein
VAIFERRHEKLAPVSVFAKRLGVFVGVALCMIGVALGIGVAGYHYLAGLGLVDSFLEASMILGGMGPVNSLTTDGAKIFASLYALFSGLVLIGVMGVILSPIVHRIMHKFHVEAEDGD